LFFDVVHESEIYRKNIQPNWLFRNIGRCALVAVALGLSAMLATGCSSTEEGFQAKLTRSAPTTRRVTESEDNGAYQPTRSPAFDPDLFGG
jgi:hypothetical protein